MARPIFRTPRSWGTDKEPMHNDPGINPETGDLKGSYGRQEDDVPASQGFSGKLPRK